MTSRRWSILASSSSTDGRGGHLARPNSGHSISANRCVGLLATIDFHLPFYASQKSLRAFSYCGKPRRRSKSAHRGSGNAGRILIKRVSGPLVVRHTSKNFLLLSRKVTVPARFDFPLTRKRWHLAQRPHRMLHFGAWRGIVALRVRVHDSVVGLRGTYMINRESLGIPLRSFHFTGRAISAGIASRSGRSPGL
jgi:hypothetical protein